MFKPHDDVSMWKSAFLKFDNADFIGKAAEQARTSYAERISMPENAHGRRDRPQRGCHLYPGPAVIVTGFLATAD